jgi:thiol:disulfide interchange protein DsbC
MGKFVSFLAGMAMFLTTIGFAHAGTAEDIRHESDAALEEAFKAFNKAKFDRLMEAIGPASLAESGITIVYAERIGYLWAVVIEYGTGQREVFYTTPDYEYVLSGNLYNKNREFTRYLLVQHARTVSLKEIPDTAEFVMGNVDAPQEKTIHVFDDPVCPFCARLHYELGLFLEEHNDWKVAVHLYPLPGHGDAEEKAKVIHCSGKDPYVKRVILEVFFADLLQGKESRYPKEVQCDMTGIEENVKFMREKAKATGTPVMILPDGRVINGFMTTGQLEELLLDR